MRSALREVPSDRQLLHPVLDDRQDLPDVAVVELLYLVPAKLVDGRDEDRAAVYKPPFGHAVPVQLTYGALLEMLLSSGDVMALREILNDLLTNPTFTVDVSYD